MTNYGRSGYGEQDRQPDGPQGQQGQQPDGPQGQQPDGQGRHTHQPGYIQQAGYPLQQGYPQQPGYPAQQGYAQPAWGQSPYGAQAHKASVGVAGAAIAAVGAVLAIIAFTAVDWFSGSNPSTFGDVRRGLDALHGTGVENRESYAYFHWLGWVLLAVTVLAAAAALVPNPLSTPMRIITPLLALASMVLTLFALKLAASVDGAPGLGEYLKHARAGFYLTLGGFLLLLVGALLGPKRSRAR